jgi:acyl dehydratase
MSDTLPAYRVVARNTSANSENLIHDDATARRYGFKGALVPGVTVYAYLTHPLVEGLGAAWLARGTASVRFLRPVLDGETVAVAGVVTRRDERQVAATVTATTESSGECATLTATLPAGSPTPVNAALYRAAPLPAERPPVSREHLAALDVLGTPDALYDADRAATYACDVSDEQPLYRGAGARVHPAFLLHLANRALDRNVRLGPWIHVGSAVRHLGGAAVGETLQARGRVRSLFEKKGRQFVELDLLLVAGAGARPVAHVLHTAIYQM